MSVLKGLDAILGGGTQFITFEDGKPLTLLFIDWYEDLMAIREHYEPSLNPKYVRCPGRDNGCPLCQANPDKYPGLKIKFRVYDPTDDKVKIVSMAKTHIQKLNTEFNLDEVDPTQEFVTVYRSGKGASDTSYSARRAKNQPAKPNLDDLEMPDLTAQVTPHTVEQIQGFMDALFNAPAQNNFPPADQGGNTGENEEKQSPSGRKLPF